ncbi:MAG: ABC transporter permease [Vulcanimicrobiaceae bacterium]
MLQVLYRYRWLLYELVVRDLVLRYRGSVLGFVWTILNPLLFMAIYTLVFSVYLRIGIAHYAVFLIAGLVPWQWFASSVQAGTSSIVDGRMFVGKTVFAPIILVLMPVLSNLVNFLFSLPILVAVVLIFHVPLGWSILALPLLLGIQFLLTSGIVMFLATLNVFFRDLQQLIAVVLLLLFYLTPIFYSLSSVPERFRPYVLGNPVAALIVSYQDIFYENSFPSWRHLLYALLASAALFYAGRAVFERYKDSFADYA